MSHNFKELKIWHLAMEITRKTQELTMKLPNSEKFGLTSQINRSSVSISSNIAEGSGRTSNKEFSRFLDIGISSSFELETQLILIEELYQIEIESIIAQLHELQRMIRGFQRKLV